MIFRQERMRLEEIEVKTVLRIAISLLTLGTGGIRRVITPGQWYEFHFSGAAIGATSVLATCVAGRRQVSASTLTLPVDDQRRRRPDHHGRLLVETTQVFDNAALVGTTGGWHRRELQLGGGYLPR